MKYHFTKLVLGSALIIIINFELSAQSTFKKTFHASGEFKSGVRTLDGGFVGCGDGGEIGLVKTDNAGNTKWSLGLKTNTSMHVYGVVENTYGDFFVLMTITVNQNDHIILALVSKSGSFLGARKFYHSSSNTAWDLESDGKGGVLIAGGGCNGSNSVIYCDKNINVIWEKGYSILSLATATTIIRNSKGNFIIGGYAYNGSSNRPQVLFEIDIDGKVLWSRCFQGFDTPGIENIFELSDGGYAIAGYGKIINPSGGTDVLITRTDKNGKVIWSRILHKGWGAAKDIIQLIDGSLLFCGVTDYNGNSDALLGKISLEGNVQFLRYIPGQLFNGGAYDLFTTILPVCDNKFALFGGVDGMMLSFINKDGIGVCNGSLIPTNGLTVIDTVFSELAFNVTETALNFHDTAYTFTSVPNYTSETVHCSYKDPSDICTITTSINDVKPVIKSVNLYPNPSNSFFTVSTENREIISQLNIYTIAGEIVRTESSINTDKFTVNLNEFKSGIYFVEVIGKDETTIARKKFIINQHRELINLIPN